MVNFKQIAEDCLAGKLSGTFVLRCGIKIESKRLIRYNVTKYPYSFTCCTDTYTNCGTISYDNRESKYDIIDFIPDMKKEQITIDIPEGKIPVMESTESGVVITWKEKELTYTELSEKFRNNINCIHTSLVNSSSKTFFKKVEVLRKLTNIRNYFGKPSKKNNDSGWVICINGTVYRAVVKQNPHVPVFAEKEHAEQAIKMLGDELKYLFEPW